MPVGKRIIPFIDLLSQKRKELFDLVPCRLFHPSLTYLPETPTYAFV